MRIVVAMSGGVDSSTAAGLLVEQGHEVIGLAMKTHNEAPRQNRACCTPDDMRDARQVADALGIPFYVLNYADLFEAEVVRPFAEAYLAGRTPNPCVACNDRVKFRTLLERAELLGADRLATGHYARVEPAEAGWRLLRGSDPCKDQAYFLYRLTSSQLANILFPVGGLHKDEVRAHARRLGLPVAEKRESQEICFVGAGGYTEIVERIGGQPTGGHIVDGRGTVLGLHAGVHRFTIGQRHGLGIAAAGPLYVTDVDAANARVEVGPRAALLCSQVTLTEVTWVGPAPQRGEVVRVQQRYRDSGAMAHIGADACQATLTFLEPTPRGAPGQAAVIYAGDEVLGGGVIAARTDATASPVLRGAALAVSQPP